jgi:hypothetical protein
MKAHQQIADYIPTASLSRTDRELIQRFAAKRADLAAIVAALNHGFNLAMRAAWVQKTRAAHRAALERVEELPPLAWRLLATDEDEAVIRRCNRADLESLRQRGRPDRWKNDFRRELEELRIPQKIRRVFLRVLEGRARAHYSPTP